MKLHLMAALAAHTLLAVAGATAQSGMPPLTEREKMLLERIHSLEERLTVLEKRTRSPESTAVQEAAVAAAAPLAEATKTPSATGTPVEPANPWLKDTTLNFFFDGYYAASTNRPLGRINLLRAYDVTANNLSINQTGMIVERAADPAAGRRWGYRLDLMYGQATETLQGGAQNEPRPQVYRNVFQAYGTYVVPLGKGLTVDFGKWASSLGAESNYTKDQINYSRSYFFNFLPFYHMGFRNTYSVNDKLSLSYWLINGANQTEDFNGFKSQMAQAVIKPASNLSWTLQYYVGREQRDLTPSLNPALPAMPTQPGLSATRIVPVSRGRFHAIDTYAFWNATRKLTLGAEFDYVINRVESGGSPQRIAGGAAYLRYQLTPKVYFGQRYVRLNDRAGLFSGVTQNLNDITSTVGFRPADGFEARLEYRRDFSNTPFFLRNEPGSLSKHQNTFTLGLLWWFGGKRGGW